MTTPQTGEESAELAGLVDPDASYLVTGGTGFVGSNLVHALVGGGARVRVLDDFSTGRRENLAAVRDRIELLEESVTDRSACREACRDVDFVLHQAALPSVQRSVAEPRPTHDVNATGTLELLMAAREAGVRRFVFAGSSSAYGDTETMPKTEDAPSRPRSPYAVAKLAGEQYCRAFYSVHGFETLALRYFNVFGPRQDPTSEYSAAIPIFITTALEGRAPTIYGDGEQTRDFTYVENVVRANLLATVAGGPGIAGEVFNVGCGERVSVNRLWRTIRDVVGTDVEAVHAPPRPGDVRHSLAGLTKIRERLGYEPAVALEEGLRRTVEWFRDGGS